MFYNVLSFYSVHNSSVYIIQSHIITIGNRLRETLTFSSVNMSSNLVWFILSEFRFQYPKQFFVGTQTATRNRLRLLSLVVAQNICCTTYLRQHIVVHGVWLNIFKLIFKPSVILSMHFLFPRVTSGVLFHEIFFGTYEDELRHERHR